MMFFSELANMVKDKNKHIVFVGLGNKLRGDDGVGCYIVDRLREQINSENLHFFDVGETVENYICKILSFKPHCIIFIDATKNGVSTEDFLLIPLEKIKNYTFSTHNISLSTVIEFIQAYARQEFHCVPMIYVLAVKVRSTELSEQLSAETKTVADEIVTEIVKYISC